jgi:hypothetical protein
MYKRIKVNSVSEFIQVVFRSGLWNKMGGREKYGISIRRGKRGLSVR